jgi:hypothetical protein
VTLEPTPGWFVDDQGAQVRFTTMFAVPAVASDVLPRRRLLAALQAGVAGPLTLVSAPAGCGKNTLVATWAALATCREGLRRSGLPSVPDWPSAVGEAAEGWMAGCGTLLPSRSMPSSSREPPGSFPVSGEVAAPPESEPSVTGGSLRCGSAPPG